MVNSLDWLARLMALALAVGLVCFLLGYLGQFIVIQYLLRGRREGSVSSTTEGEGGAGSRTRGPARALKVLVEGWMRYSLLVTGRLPSHRVRNFIYRHIYGLRLARKAVLYGGSEIRSPFNIEIAEGAIVGDNSILDGRSGITIGRNANLSTGVWIWTLQHDPQCPDFSCRGGAGKVTIGERAWISCRVVILPGVTIGAGAVVAAGSVVTKDLEPFSINGGIPAKKIGVRNPDLVYEFDGSHLPFY